MTKYWHHVGGGCAFTAGKFPCDDAYERRGEHVSVLTTRERHGNMPTKTISISALKRLKGVGRVVNYSGKTRRLEQRTRR